MRSLQLHKLLDAFPRIHLGRRYCFPERFCALSHEKALLFDQLPLNLGPRLLECEHERQFCIVRKDFWYADEK